MWRFQTESQYAVADQAPFLAELNRTAGLFDPRRPLVAARAPGRLDLMGGIADYSGALVLQLPLAAGTWVAAQRTPEPVATVRTIPPPGFEGTPEVSVSLAELMPPGRPLTLSEAQCRLAVDARRRWAAYVLGALPMLHRERGVELDHGLSLLVYSEVPLGKGVSSSAALEVAALRAITGLIELELDGRTLALLAQQVENHVVGAPCGVMDQMTGTFGEQDRLLALLCQPAELQGHVPLPPAIEVFGIDSGIRHAISGAEYEAVRVGAFMGHRMIAELTGLPRSVTPDGRVEIDGGRFSGYLANVTPAAWEEHFRGRVPEHLLGRDFLDRYGGTTDAATRVDPGRKYHVRTTTAHPIYEHDRVLRFRSLLQAEPTEENLQALGELMYASHASYSACGLGTDGTDRLVELVREAGPACGLYGARITGGGAGGTVAVLGTRHSYSQVRRIARQYQDETGRRVAILGGSSPGSLQFGLARLVFEGD